MRRPGFIVCSCVFYACGLATATEIGVASFNLAWAGTQADFVRHIEVCNSQEVNWCDTRAKIKAGTAEPTRHVLELSRCSDCSPSIF